MGRNAQKRRNKKKQQIVEAPKKKRNLWIPTLVAGLSLAGLAIGASLVYPSKKQERTYSTPREKQETKIRDFWESSFLEKPMSRGELFQKSKTMRDFRDNNIQVEPIFSAKGKRLGTTRQVVKKFLKYPTPKNYSVAAFGVLLRGNAGPFKIVSGLSKKIGPQQINLDEIMQRAKELRSLPDDEAFSELLNLSYFLTRSNYHSTDNVDIHAKNLAELMLQGKGDCQTNSYMGLLNFHELSCKAGKPKLTERLRIMDGFSKNSSDNLDTHTWLETRDSTIIEYNWEIDDPLFQKSYTPGKDYMKKFKGLNKGNYVPLFRTEPIIIRGKIYYKEKILVLPEEIMQEIKKTAPD